MNKTILFAEDDPFVLNLYRGRLQAAGFTVESAADGLAAIEALPRIRPDAVVLDLLMPKLHGLEVLKFIRADVELKATPVVVLSNAYMESLATRAIKAGADVGILKAKCTPTRLIRTLRYLVGKAASQDKPASKADDLKVLPASPGEGTLDEACRESARIELLRFAPGEIAQIRQDCLAYVKMGGSRESLEYLKGLFRRVHFLSARAGLSGCMEITDLASALEAMLYEIVTQASQVTRSSLHTTAQAVDCLASLLQDGDLNFNGRKPQPKVLVVDDDEVCNYVTVRILKRAKFDAVSVSVPEVGLAMLEAGRYDLVLLDIHMPGLNGFEVCDRLRRIPHHQTTPVIFITVDGEFRTRARAILAGGNDLITKPISPLELAVKVIIRLLLSGGPRPSATLAAEAVHAGLTAVAAEQAADTADSAFGDQPRAERFGAPPNLGLAQSAPAGAKSPDRTRPSEVAVSASLGAFSAVSDPESSAELSCLPAATGVGTGQPDAHGHGNRLRAAPVTLGGQVNAVEFEVMEAKLAELQSRCAAAERRLEAVSSSLAQTWAPLLQEIPSPAYAPAPDATSPAAGGEAPETED